MSSTQWDRPGGRSDESGGRERKDLFKEAQAAFAPIVGAPNDDDVKHLTKVFINALQSIDVPGGAINLSDLLMSDNDHEDRHRRLAFARMAFVASEAMLSS